MTRLRQFGLLIALLGLACTCSAQGTNGGLLYASDFAKWTLPTGNSPARGTILWPNGEICKVTAAGYNFVGPKVGRPITIADAQPFLTETVTPTAVSIASQNCQVSATMSHTHSTYQVQSGTAGLQEAIDYQAGAAQGSMVILTPAWTAAGGTTGMITAATGNTNVTILDERTSVFVPYTWNGSAYVAQPFAGVNISNQANGVIPLATAPTVIAAQSHLDDGVTTTNTITASRAFTANVNKVISVIAPPYNAKCDGVTDDQTAIQSAFNDALSGNQSVQFPAGTCLTSAITYKGQSFFGAGQLLTTILGKPGQDVFHGCDGITDTATGCPTVTPVLYKSNVQIHDLTIETDNSINASSSPQNGNVPAGTGAFPNRITGTATGTTPISAGNGGPPAPGNFSLVGGALNSGATTLTSTAGGFTNVTNSAMVIGQPLTITGAGAAGGTYTGTITAVNSNTSINFSPATSTTVASISGSWGNAPTPPWYIGNAGIAIASSDWNEQSGGVNGWKIERVKFTGTGGFSWNGHTAGFFLQNEANDMHCNYCNFHGGNYGGWIEALPALNVPGGPGFAFTPDNSSYIDFDFNDYLPLVTYNGSHRRYTGISLFTSAPFITGMWQLQTTSGSPTSDFSEFYDEPSQYSQGEHARFSGVANINGGSLQQSSSVGLSPLYTNFFTNNSVVNAKTNGLSITGNGNTFQNAGQLSGFFSDTGGGNGTIYNPTNSTTNSYYIPYRQPANTLSTDFLRGGNITTDAYTSMSDMFLTPEMFNYAVTPYTIVMDSNAPLTGRYAAIPSTGLASQFHYVGGSVGWVVGSNFAQTKGMFYVTAKALNTNTVMTVRLIAGTSTLLTLSCSFNSGVYSTCSGIYDASGQAAGTQMKVDSNGAPSPATEVDIAWMAAVPDMNTLRTTNLILNGTALNPAATQKATQYTTGGLNQLINPCPISGNWQNTSATCATDSTSPTGNAATLGTSNSNQFLGIPNIGTVGLSTQPVPSVINITGYSPLGQTQTLTFVCNGTSTIGTQSITWATTGYTTYRFPIPLDNAACSAGVGVKVTFTQPTNPVIIGSFMIEPGVLPVIPTSSGQVLSAVSTAGGLYWEPATPVSLGGTNTWTANNTFNTVVTGTGAVSSLAAPSAFSSQASTPGFSWEATGQGTNQKWWLAWVNGTNFIIQSENDAYSSGIAAMTIARGSGTALSSITFGAPVIVGATAFTVSGCGTAGSITGNGSAGSFTVGTGTTNCTFTVTLNGATGMTAPHGWIANADDTTANIHCVNSATVSATTVVFVCTGTIATSDVIKFSAVPY